MTKFNRKLTLEELENEIWEAPTFQSHLVKECHRLRKVPIDEFTVENLRIMLGQKFGLKYLLPIALEKLFENPFVSGDFFRGDLLTSVLKIEWEFWGSNPELFHMLQEVMFEVESILRISNETIMPSWQSFFNEPRC